jgi:hypothetical protein
VANALSRSPGLEYIHEPDNPERNPVAWPAVRAYGLLPILDQGDPAPAYAMLWDHILVKDNAGLLGSPRARRLLAKQPGWLADPLISLVAGAVGAVSPATPTSVVKSVQLGFSLEWIAARYQPAIVLVKRHPLNVVGSWRTLGWRAPNRGEPFVLWPRFDALALELDAPPPPAEGSLARIAWWIAVQMLKQEEITARHPEWIVVSHEDACLSPVEVFQQVCREAGIGWSEDVVEYLESSNKPGEGAYQQQRISRDQSDSWRRALSTEEANEVISVLRGFPGAWWQDRMPAPGRVG